jgi:hypothetical protein
MSLAELFRTYVLLLALLGIEYGASLLRLGPALRPLILLPAFLMAGVMAMRFMELRHESATVLLFTTAGVLWLLILLGLGLADPLTRAIYPAPGAPVY